MTNVFYKVVDLVSVYCSNTVDFLSLLAGIVALIFCFRLLKVRY